METAVSLYREGRLQAAVDELSKQLRRQPENTKMRSFLFELLCFAGEFKRAESQLDVLAAQNGAAASGASTLRGLLQAQYRREKIFESKNLPFPTENTTRDVLVNGDLHSSCIDEDSRINGLEIYGASGYEIIPWTKVSSLKISRPSTLRDLLWIPATLLTNSVRPDEKTISIYLPALAPFSWKHPEDAVRLGRSSVIEETEDGGPIPFGAKLLICDTETISLLDIRSIEVI